MNQSIIDKIRKLLALATSSNEHEARLAAEKASELLVRHNLSVQDLTKDEYVGAILRSGGRLAPQARWVMRILELHFFVAVVKVRLVPLGRTDINVIGTPTNVAVARYVFGFLYDAFPRLWANYKKQTRRRNDRRRVNYYAGLAAGLHAQLRAVRKKAEDDMALVVVPDPHLKDAVKHLIGDIQKRAVRRFRRDLAVEAGGIKDGLNLKIRSAIEKRGDGAVRQIEGGAE